MAYIDFAELKARITIEQVATFLKLDTKKSASQLRGSCPACNSDDKRTLAITPAKSLFYCFTAQLGGDQIALAAHILGCDAKQAAQALNEHFNISSTVPRSVKGDEGQKLQALDYLEHDHPAVEAVGFDPHIAASLGIGYAGRGMMRGLVAVPVRDEHGVLKGYLGISEARLPPDFQTNVVQLRKPA